MDKKLRMLHYHIAKQWFLGPIQYHSDKKSSEIHDTHHEHMLDITREIETSVTKAKKFD